MTLTRTQKSTLRMIAGGMSRIAVNNKSAIALKKAGLVKHHVPFGWVLTQEGQAKHSEITSE